MTKLLNSAFEEISKLPELEQNIFARFIIDEVESEKNGKKILQIVKIYFQIWQI